MGVVHIHRQQSQIPFVQVRNHGFQGIFASQRDVTVQHQHPGIIRQCRQRLGHRMAGAQLFGLQHPVHRVVFQRRPNLIGSVTNHRVNFLRAQLFCGINHMVQHGFTRHRMQHLGQGGFHAGALACGQDHNV